jgi:hypothetical protein
MNIWPNKTSLRQVLIKHWQANTTKIHNKTLLRKNKTKCNTMRQLWCSINGLNLTDFCDYECRAKTCNKNRDWHTFQQKWQCPRFLDKLPGFNASMRTLAQRWHVCFYLSHAHEILCRWHKLLSRCHELLSRGHVIVKSLERDTMSWPRVIKSWARDS